MGHGATQVQTANFVVPGAPSLLHAPPLPYWSKAGGHLRSPAIGISARMGPPCTADPGVVLDRATVSEAFCWLDTAEMLYLAEDEAGLIGLPPPEYFVPIWIPLEAWPITLRSSRASGRTRDGLQQLVSTFYVTYLLQHIKKRMITYGFLSLCLMLIILVTTVRRLPPSLSPVLNSVVFLFFFIGNADSR